MDFISNKWLFNSWLLVCICSGGVYHIKLKKISINTWITVFNNQSFSWFWDYLRTWFTNKEQENHKNIVNGTEFWWHRVICMGGTDQFGTNTCQHNKNMSQILNHLHLFWESLNSLINEYNDTSPFSNLPSVHIHLFFFISFSYRGHLLL